MERRDVLRRLPFQFVTHIRDRNKSNDLVDTASNNNCAAAAGTMLLSRRAFVTGTAALIFSASTATKAKAEPKGKPTTTTTTVGPTTTTTTASPNPPSLSTFSVKASRMRGDAVLRG